MYLFAWHSALEIHFDFITLWVFILCFSWLKILTWSQNLSKRILYALRFRRKWVIKSNNGSKKRHVWYIFLFKNFTINTFFYNWLYKGENSTIDNAGPFLSYPNNNKPSSILLLTGGIANSLYSSSSCLFYESKLNFSLAVATVGHIRFLGLLSVAATVLSSLFALFYHVGNVGGRFVACWAFSFTRSIGEGCRKEN